MHPKAVLWIFRNLRPALRFREELPLVREGVTVVEAILLFLLADPYPGDHLFYDHPVSDCKFSELIAKPQRRDGIWDMDM